MPAAKFFAAITFCLTATLAQAAGFRFTHVPADAGGPALNGAMWYHCAAPSREIAAGTITLPRVDITLVEALIFALALSVLSSPRPDAPPPALLAPI